MVWGAMIALSTIANLKGDDLYKHLEILIKVMEDGSVIAVDHVVKILAVLASQNEDYNTKIFPVLLNHLRSCRPKELNQHAESIMLAVNKKNQDSFIKVLREREGDLTPSQFKKINKLYKKLYANALS